MMMVERKKLRDLGSDLEPVSSCREKLPVKLEIHDPLEQEHASVNKRLKTSFALNYSEPEGWIAGSDDALCVAPTQYNPLDEPSPLGLSLRKSPSLLDLIQMKLSQGTVSTAAVAESENLMSGVKSDCKGAVASITTDKLKASNFPALLLRIGCWEYKSKYEGDLVAKCYFAKHKLVWEVIEGSLKSKIEIQWSDIMALKANYPDKGPSTLTVVLARQPLFFRETDPQPRKHTLWQAAADFTDGQASIHRQHFLQCSHGVLNKHFEKLIQCDMRLNFLSQQQGIALGLPYSVFENQHYPKYNNLDQLKNGNVSVITGIQDIGKPLVTQASSLKTHHDPADLTFEPLSIEAPSPSSVMDHDAIEDSGSSEIVGSKAPSNWDNIDFPGLHPSISMSDFMSQIGNCISEQMNTGNPPFSCGGLHCQDLLENIAHCMLSDNQFNTSDEKYLMSRVNSLCCLLQKEPSAVQNSQIGENTKEHDDGKNDLLHTYEYLQENGSRNNAEAHEEDINDVYGGKQAQGLLQKDSNGELLLHLPRVASLPKFLFHISEDCESESLDA